MSNTELHDAQYRRSLVRLICNFIIVGDTVNASELLEEYLNYWRNN